MQSKLLLILVLGTVLAEVGYQLLEATVSFTA